MLLKPKHSEEILNNPISNLSMYQRIATQLWTMTHDPIWTLIIQFWICLKERSWLEFDWGLKERSLGEILRNRQNQDMCLLGWFLLYNVIVFLDYDYAFRILSLGLISTQFSLIDSTRALIPGLTRYALIITWNFEFPMIHNCFISVLHGCWFYLYIFLEHCCL